MLLSRFNQISKDDLISLFSCVTKCHLVKMTNVLNIQTEFQVQLQQVKDEIESLKVKIEALELKRENAEANLLNASPEDRLVYVYLLNSATAELTRLGQKRV